MILASVQTAADTAPFSGYLEGVCILLASVGGFVGACWLFDRYVATPYLKPRIAAALGRGDVEVRRFIAEIEAYEAEQAAQARRVR